MFHEQAVTASSRYAIVAVLGVCAVAAVAGLAIVTVRHAQRQPARASDTRSRPEVPLELLELEHERDGEELVVRGIVRNPATAAERDRLTAVVLVIGHDGGLISTARAAVPAVRLAPGATTPFVVSVTGAADVDRFRLSFHTGAR